MLKKVLFLVFLSVFFLPANVFAHVLESDGSVGAVMHVTPDDDPVAGEESGFYFEFKDKTNKFKAENCICTIAIEKNGEEIFSQNLFANNSDPSLSNASATFIFPEKNIYRIIITGQPKKPEDFEAFEFSYDLRVERETEKKIAAQEVTEENKQLPIAPIIVGVIAVVAGGYFLFGKRKSK